MSSDRAPLDRSGIERWLVEQFTSGLAAAVEAMAGAPATATFHLQSSAPATDVLLWRQPLAPISGALLVAAAEDSWSAIGRHILSAAGVEDSETAEQRSTCLEVLGQALSGLAQNLTALLQKEVTCADGTEAAAVPSGVSWASIEVMLGETPAKLDLGIESALLEVLEPALASPQPAPQAHGGPAQASAGHGNPAHMSAEGTRTFDLLLDVELPVSVSFGHAMVLLKDVLKLTTGSIVELDRAIVEPVDIVVNNCVIARGEVVVVEGNFGVRIQHVVSREERVRTFQ